MTGLLGWPTLTLELPYGRVVKVTPYIWRSWTGRRFLDGVEVIGPVYHLGSAWHCEGPAEWSVKL